MNHEALADRLVNYADAAAAFTVVNAIAFLVALTETDIRCSLADTKSVVVAGQVASSVLVAVAVTMLRRAELRVRASTQVPPDIARYLRNFFIVRLVVVALTTAFTVTSALGALTDPTCQPPAL